MAYLITDPCQKVSSLFSFSFPLSTTRTIGPHKGFDSRILQPADLEVDEGLPNISFTAECCPPLQTSASMAKKDLFDEADSGSESISGDADGRGLKINEEYARRFEHNKKREERQRRK